MKSRFACLLFTLALLGMPTIHAAIPDSFSYQGYLTNPAGAPVDATVNITFNIYSISSGGSPLWSDTQSVTVSKGLFSVELGNGTFPASLFDTPLWLGIAVAADAEMTPRKPIDSAAFAFKADDALTLDGQSASSLDQSAHVGNTANPHSVTTGQIGAADAAALGAHVTNTSNPHSVTAAQTGAPTTSTFNSHAVDSSAHHSRYSDTEAVVAMGATVNANPLNHNRYNNSEAVAAIKAADGAGSTLDADLVDGLQASELIDAAQDEVRTPISSLPYTISQPGSYYLTGNLDGSSGGIDIIADGVTLDLMGFTIDGGGTVNDFGIAFTNHRNVTIRNGTVRGFGRAGIYQGSATGRYATVIDIKALNNGALGTASDYSGIYITGHNHHIERCTSGVSGGSGIVASFASKLLNNTVYSNSGSYGIYGGSGSVLSGNTAYDNITLYAVFGDTGSVVSDNTVYNNIGSVGIFVNSGTKLSGNVVYSHDGQYGIYASSGSSIIGNAVTLNLHWGIYALGSALIKDNTISFNNSSNTAGEGGLRVGNDSRVIGNTLDVNNQNNIVVTSTDNALIGNHVTDSTNGINFITTGNYYRENTASGNSSAFLNGGLQASGGGNFAF